MIPKNGPPISRELFKDDMQIDTPYLQTKPNPINYHRPIPDYRLTFAHTHIGDYNIATIRLDYDTFETSIWCPNIKLQDYLKIGHYVKVTNDKRTALQQHIQAIWHVQNSNREGDYL